MLIHECYEVNGKISFNKGRKLYIVSCRAPREGDKVVNYFEYYTLNDAIGVIERYFETLELSKNNKIDKEKYLVSAIV